METKRRMCWVRPVGSRDTSKLSLSPVVKTYHCYPAGSCPPYRKISPISREGFLDCKHGRRLPTSMALTAPLVIQFTCFMLVLEYKPICQQVTTAALDEHFTALVLLACDLRSAALHCLCRSLHAHYIIQGFCQMNCPARLEVTSVSKQLESCSVPGWAQRSSQT